MKGFTITPTACIGDLVQFTSLPENYFMHTGERLVDVNKHWVFDHNPYICRETEPTEVIELWSSEVRAKPRNSVFLSNAEHHASLLGVPVVLNRPRLYKYENYPMRARDSILLQTVGNSHGEMPDRVIQHVKKKYFGLPLFHLGFEGHPDIGLEKICPANIWDLVQIIAHARMVIGLDSGPAWIAACFPDVIVKKLRMRPDVKKLEDWVPLEISNIHSYWDDRMFQVFNPSEDDVGFTSSYRRI